MNTAANLNELVIDRRTWLRGNTRPSTLRNEKGEMCCLGFRALQCGYGAETIKFRSTPRSLINSDDVKRGFELLVDTKRFRNSVFADDAMNINDAGISETEREVELIKLFANNGIALTFEN